MHPAAASPSPIRPGSLDAWIVATRPRTLWIAAIPVLVGSAMAWQESRAFSLGLGALAIVGAILMQLITNLQNDVGYTLRGAETGGRVGLPRATAKGWLTPAQVRWAIAAAITVACVIGLPLVAYRGWPILPIGLVSIAAAVSYMGGPRPIAYTPCGELTVFAFFGLVAVAGTAFVQAGTVGAGAWLAGTSIGMLAAAVLVVNNYRDIAHDRAVGRRTFPVTFGQQASRNLFTVLLLAPFALLAMQAAIARSAWLALPVVALPTALRLVRDFVAASTPLALTGVLFRTVLLEVAYGLLLTAGAVLASL